MWAGREPIGPDRPNEASKWHLTLVAAWNKAAIAGLGETFSAKAATPGSGVEAELARLHAKIGQLVMERDFLAKASGR